MNSVIQYVLYLAILIVLAVPLGSYMKKVMNGEHTLLSGILSPCEQAVYRVMRIDPEEQMNWKQYALSVLLFSGIGLVFLFLLQLLQGALPGNPQHLPGVTWDLAFNTAASFVTNTNWQAYSGESTLSYLTQALGLTVQNFVSAATGIAVLFALIRGFIQVKSAGLGSFWVDLTRIVLHILLPLNLVIALLLVSGGVIQNFKGGETVPLLEPIAVTAEGEVIEDAVIDTENGEVTVDGEPVDAQIVTEQFVPMGPAASQVAIKQTGTNGGGFMGVNSAHPLENPSAFTNLIEMLSLLLIPAALCFTFGKAVDNKKQGIAIFLAMLLMLVVCLGVVGVSEQAGTPQLAQNGAVDLSTVNQAGGNMEGKETRFGIAASSTWSVFTTAASNGSVNSMHDSYTPLGGMIQMLQMQLGEVIFGGVGCGLYGMLAFAILTVFIAGLMVGRTPEFLGKKIEPYEMKWSVLVYLATPIAILAGSGIAAVIPSVADSLTNSGAHGFSEMLYAYTSEAGNNGSAFAGFNANTVFLNVSIALVMLFARFLPVTGTLAIAEGRGKAQADTLRASRKDVDAHRIPSAAEKDKVTVVASALLKKGDLVIVRAGEQIPADGEIIEGAASVDESAITGESAPVIREAGGDRSAVTGGTTVLSDWIVVRVTNEAGESFLDKMIAMVEGASRKKTPNEIALQIFLVALSIIFILVTVSLYTYSAFSARQAGIENPTSVTTLVALLVCLAPTTIGALLSAIGIAGMSRLNQANVLAMSGRAIEAAGDVDVLLLDKTGTITLGNRRAVEFIPVDGTDIRELADAAQLSSLADETPEGRSVVILAKEQFGIRGRTLQDKGMQFIPFTAQTRMSGVNYDGCEIRKGAADAMQAYVTQAGGTYSGECDQVVKSIATRGGTPLVVAKDHRILGVIYLKDIIKDGVKEKFADLRKMGIRTIMITGDNPITAAAIAAEAGVDDFLAEATPEGKLKMIREYQAKGHLVTMTGDGTNDAQALAQADVAVAMNSGTQAAKEAGNMVDLDSSPTKLIDIVRIGKQLLMTRGSLTTFSIANDVAKYFAIIPALFTGLYPGLSALNIMGLHSPRSAVLSAIIYNALIIIALIPLALKGVKYREVSAGKLLSRNLLVYGLGGLAAPFIFIKLIDVLLTLTGLV